MHYLILVTCIKIIAAANNKQTKVFIVGISPINIQANVPNTNVPIPKPANLIFQDRKSVV